MGGGGGGGGAALLKINETLGVHQPRPQHYLRIQWTLTNLNPHTNGHFDVLSLH